MERAACFLDFACTISRERHLQNLGSEPLAAPPPPAKRRKTAAVAAKAPRAASAPAAAAATEDSEDGEDTLPQPSDEPGPIMQHVSQDSADEDAGAQLAARTRPDTRHDTELAVELAAELEHEQRETEGGGSVLAGSAAAGRSGFRSDPGAGPSSAPPAEEEVAEASDEEDAGARHSERPKRGGGAGSAFDALREAKAAAEVRVPCGTTGTQMSLRMYMQGWLSVRSCKLFVFRMISPGCNKGWIRLQARSTARASGLPAPPAPVTAAADASSDDSDEELVLVPEVRCQRLLLPMRHA